MCLSPIYIDNPNYGARSPTVVRFKDTTSVKIPIPCGHCSACIQLRQQYFVQRVQMEALEHDIYSCMLSYNDKYLPTIDINGFRHKYADKRDIQLFIKRLRNHNIFGCDFKFFAISEFGGKRHRPHWHLLFFLPKPAVPYSIYEHWQREEYFKWKVLDEWYFNLGSKRNPIKDPLLTYCEKNGKRNYDFHYVNPFSSDGQELDVAFYSSKYLTKSSKHVKNLQTALRLNLSTDDYRYYWNLIKPHSLCSLHFGLGLSPYTKVLDYINECVDFSLKTCQKYPVFITPLTGQTFPLSPYLLKARGGLFPTEFDFFRYIDDGSFISGTNVRITEPLHSDEIKLREERFSRIQEKINKRDIGDYLSPDSGTANDLLSFNSNEKVNFNSFADFLTDYDFFSSTSE